MGQLSKADMTRELVEKSMASYVNQKLSVPSEWADTLHFGLALMQCLIVVLLYIGDSIRESNENRSRYTISYERGSDRSSGPGDIPS